MTWQDSNERAERPLDPGEMSRLGILRHRDGLNFPMQSAYPSLTFPDAFQVRDSLLPFST